MEIAFLNEKKKKLTEYLCYLQYLQVGASFYHLLSPGTVYPSWALIALIEDGSLANTTDDMESHNLVLKYFLTYS